jgi:bacteriocin-like protein
MKELTLNQMANVTGGGWGKILGCTFASIGLAVAFVGLVTATGGAALAAAAIGYSIAPAAWGLSCFADLD